MFICGRSYNLACWRGLSCEVFILFQNCHSMEGFGAILGRRIHNVSSSWFYKPVSLRLWRGHHRVRKIEFGLKYSLEISAERLSLGPPPRIRVPAWIRRLQRKSFSLQVDKLTSKWQTIFLKIQQFSPPLYASFTLREQVLASSQQAVCEVSTVKFFLYFEGSAMPHVSDVFHRKF